MQSPRPAGNYQLPTAKWDTAAETGLGVCCHDYHVNCDLYIYIYSMCYWETKL